MASALFAPITLRSLALKNRIVVSPMCQYNSDNGTANDWHLMHLGQFSLGAGALVMTESTHVSAEGRISLKCAGMYSDENEAAMKRVIDFCRKYGVTAQGLQLGHAARRAHRLRSSRAARRARLSRTRIPVADLQPAHRRVRRQPGKPHALPARDLCRDALGVARRKADGRADFCHRLGRRRLE